jgi:hypothetical protein
MKEWRNHDHAQGAETGAEKRLDPGGGMVYWIESAIGGI